MRYLPKCVSPNDYRAWEKLQPKAGKAGFCEDCTPEFQNKMIALGLCDHPEIKFCRDENGMLTGLVECSTQLTFDLFLN